jgi:hypothetical protein
MRKQEYAPYAMLILLCTGCRGILGISDPILDDAGSEVSTTTTNTGTSTSTSTSVKITTTTQGATTSTTRTTTATGSSIAFGGVIDDMSQPANPTGGYWYVYSDRLVPYSDPAKLLTPTPPGSVTPPEGGFTATIDSGLPSGVQHARECSGGGETNWGIGFGMDFIDVSPDGGPVPMNQCDAGVVFDNHSTLAAGVGVQLPYDAGAHKGFAFRAMSPDGPHTLEVHVADDRSVVWGGKCNACANGTAGACSDDYMTTVTVSKTWTQYVVEWAQLATLNWSKAGLPDGGLDTKLLYYIHFQLTTTPPKALPTFDVLVADLRWVDN